jgi:nucleoside-diphosphate-sugar epimerase
MVANQLVQDAKTVLDATDLSKLNGKTVLLTGASGLIGTHILYSLEEFVRRGGKLGKCYALIYSEPLKHLSQFTRYEWFEFLRGDITDSLFLAGLPNADFIIHSAGYAQPQKFMADPVRVISMNTSSTIALLNRLNSGGGFAFISSSAVYTGCKELPYKETHIGCSNTNHPRSGYIEGKRCGEAIVNAYRNMGTDAKSIRLQLAYGPGVRADDARVLSQFIIRAKTEGRIDLVDDGSAERVYIYATDATELIWKILLSGKSDIYNLAGNSKTTIFQLAKEIGEILNVSVSKQKAATVIAGAVSVEELDMAQTTTEFEKETFIELDEGLRRTVSWMGENAE